jgi:phosphoglycolate phosphatase
VHLVLFDVDGTLIDSQHMICAAMSEAFAAADRPAPGRAEVLAVVGLSLPAAIHRLLGDDPSPLATIVAAYKAAFSRMRGEGRGEPLYPGARAALDALARCDDVLLGLATGNSRRGVAAFIARHGLEGRFATIQTADDHPSKPHPAMVTAALAETGVAPERAVMVGDTAFDVAMGRAAGIVAVGVGWGYHSASRLVEAGAAAVIEDFAELGPTLATLFGRPAFA